ACAGRDVVSRLCASTGTVSRSRHHRTVRRTAPARAARQHRHNWEQTLISVEEQIKEAAAPDEANVPITAGRKSAARRSIFWLQVVAFLLGLALLVYIINRVGVQPIFDALAQIGFGLFAILAINGARHLIRAVALRVAVPPEHRHFNVWQAFTTRLGGEAVSFLTFTGPVLGEATKAALLRKRVTLVTAAQ